MDNERDPILEAAWYLDAGYPHEALETLGGADPTDARAAYIRGRALIAVGRDREAEQVALDALSLEPENVYLLELLTYAQIARDAAAAELTVRKALALDPENVLPVAAYVMVLMEQGRFEAAGKMLERLMRIAPEEEATHRVRTAFLLRSSGSNEAVTAAREFLKAYPDDAYAHYVNGMAMLSGPWWRGLRHLRQAAALRPHDPLLAETARVMRSWYLWPVHLTSGVVHWLLSTLVLAATIIDLVREGTAWWKWLLLSFSITGYKWAAFFAARFAIERRVRRNLA